MKLLITYFSIFIITTIIWNIYFDLKIQKFKKFKQQYSEQVEKFKKDIKESKNIIKDLNVEREQNIIKIQKIEEDIKVIVKIIDYHKGIIKLKRETKNLKLKDVKSIFDKYASLGAKLRNTK